LWQLGGAIASTDANGLALRAIAATEIAATEIP